MGVAGFAWPGFFAFLLSVLLEALRVVYIQLLLGRLNYNSMEACVLFPDYFPFIQQERPSPPNPTCSLFLFAHSAPTIPLACRPGDQYNSVIYSW